MFATASLAPLIRASLLLALLWSGAGWAQVAVPELRGRVTDLTATLQPAQIQTLEAKLATFERERGSQVAVLLVPTTQPETIEQYAIRVVEQWKLGRAQQDDGVLLLIAKADRTLRIEVGQGLEGAIPDALAKRIIEEQMLPRLREGDFAGGIEAGVDAVLGLIRGEQLPAPAQNAASVGSAFEKALPLLFVLIFAGQFLRQLLGRLPGAGLVGGFAFLLGWLLTGAVLIALLFALAGFVLTLTGMAGGGGGWHSRGGGGGGGFGDGGFRGGGGGFSGGGASGRW